MLRRADGVVVVPTWREARGARLEVWLAHRWNIPVLTLEELMAGGLPSKAQAA
jgi:hypothetical protein